ncbi:H/ACA ribonucleoprotein complex subunit 2-like protein [Cimex lectularius]|uniref:Ribosomal protein eL8/eL30/eS12/Gadd45 domain-containing protein n=1 Tax=Cimex lectularius TaxID=79782 RepID=A0A8I6S4E3_CIMLE|nr:H/ACA ribonucleoprotein complex subunit 2-like protein [Cimex lectularius]
MTKDKKKQSLSEFEEQPPEDTSMMDSKQVLTYEERLKFVNEIAKPLASRKLTKKIYKLIKKSHKEGKAYWSGLKNVQARLRKGDVEGIAILAGDVSPIDVYTHVPAVCEDKDVPYVFVPSREDIGLAMGVNRAVIAAYIGESEGYKELYDEVKSEIKSLPIPI